jgi:hypothetical protein
MPCIAEPVTDTHGIRYSLCGWPTNGQPMLSTLAEAEALKGKQHVCPECLSVARREVKKQPAPL